MPVYTFSRSSIAYLSDGTQVAANQPRFEAGKFGKAVLVEEGTTNLLQNPSFETGNFSSWYRFTTYGGATYEVTSEKTWHGSYSAKITADGTASASVGISQGRISATAGVPYTFSVKLAGTLGANKVYLVFRWVTADDTIIKDDNFYISEVTPQAFKTHSATATAPENTAKMEVHIRIVKDAVGVLYVDAAQLEAKPYTTSFIDGTRSPEALTIPTEGVLNPQEGTVECWVYVNDILKDSIVDSRHIIDARGSGNNALILYHDRVTRNFRFRLRNYSGVEKDLDIPDSVVTNGWHFFSIKWSQTNMTLCIDNNAQFAENPPLPSDLSTCTIGRHPSVPTTTINTLIDDLRISSRARSDAEILAAYQSGLPAEWDEWTTLKLNFSYFESIVINSSVSGVGRKLTRQATNISSAMTMTGRATRGKRAHATANAAVSISGTARRLMRTSAAINITLGLIGRLWNAFQRIYFLLSHIEYKPDLFVEEYVINLEHVDYEIKLEVIGLAISGSTITLKATFQDSAGDLQELENVVVKIYAPGKVLLETIPATKISTGVYTADYTIPEDKEGQFDYEFSGSLGNRTIVGRSSFDSHWR